MENVYMFASKNEKLMQAAVKKEKFSQFRKKVHYLQHYVNLKKWGTLRSMCGTRIFKAFGNLTLNFTKEKKAFSSVSYNNIYLNYINLFLSAFQSF